MIGRFRLFTAELIHRCWSRPMRRRAFLRRTKEYLHVTPEGLRFWLQPGEIVDQYIAVEGLYERRYLHFLARILPDGAVIIDIGAHIGNHALYLHRKCAAVHCFEPNPKAADRLQRNIDVNRASNVHLHRFALGAKDETLLFSSNSTGNLGNSGFFDPQGREGFERIELPVRNGDGAIIELALERVDLVKMDVEGFEQQVVDGLPETLAKFQPLVAFEFHAHLAKPDDFKRLKAGFGSNYRIAEPAFAPEGSSLLRRTAYHLQHGDRMTLREVCIPESRSYELLLAIPNDHPLAGQIIPAETLQDHASDVRSTRHLDKSDRRREN